MFKATNGFYGVISFPKMYTFTDITLILKKLRHKTYIMSQLKGGFVYSPGMHPPGDWQGRH